jgi:hypothetical protein
MKERSFKSRFSKFGILDCDKIGKQQFQFASRTSNIAMNTASTRKTIINP